MGTAKCTHGRSGEHVRNVKELGLARAVRVPGRGGELVRARVDWEFVFHLGLSCSRRLAAAVCMDRVSQAFYRIIHMGWLTGS